MEELTDIIPYVVATGGVYFGLLTTGSIAQLMTEKIMSESELKQVTQEEAEKLNLKKKKNRIMPFLYTRNEARERKILGAKSHMIGLDLETETIREFEEVNDKNIIPMGVVELVEGYGATRGTIRHELYHIHKHHPPSEQKWRRTLNWFYQEPAAVLYAVTGIKI